MNYPMTHIHPDAKIAAGVTIEPFTSIYKNVEIGEGTWIGPNVTIMEGARIGKNCKIFPGAVVSGTPQDLKFAGEDTITIIGDNTTIRECVTVSRGTTDKYKTEIGSNCLIMAYAHVAHDCVIGNNCILANAVQVAGHVEIGDFAIVGGATAIHQFVKIGAHAFISGGSLVRKDVPPYTKAGREPLSFCGLNSTGLKRRQFTSEQINQIHDMYRILFMRDLAFSKALKQIEEEVPASSFKDEIVNFLKASKRGIMKGFMGGTSED